MSTTGRLGATLDIGLQRLVYGAPDVAATAQEMGYVARIDRAHLAMLERCGLVPAGEAASLLVAIDALQAQDFAPLTIEPAPRGLYLAYENLLARTVGADAAGRLHTGRSRNDLKATVTALRLRDRLVHLTGVLSRLQVVLVSRARAHADVVMPVHTHFQAALPATYGWYLAGVATALGRELAALQASAADADAHCPMGAGAAAGCELPVDPAMVARLLGFAGPPRHALDAVASRDTVLRALAGAASAAVLISRLGTDLQLWTTAEFGFVALPDRLVGGSSAMPQKRNAFLLEHVRAGAGAVIGAWTACATSMHAAPFTNSIEVGTDAVAAAWPGFAACERAARLATAVVSGARPVPDRMRAGAEGGFVVATAIANHLVRQGEPFRHAHHRVGAAVRRAVADDRDRLTSEDLCENECEHLHEDLAQGPDGDALSLDAVTSRQRCGGPGDVGALVEGLRQEVRLHAEVAAGRLRRDLDALAELRHEVSRVHCKAAS